MSNKRKYSEDEDSANDKNDQAECHQSADALRGETIPKDKLMRPKLFKNAKNDCQRLIIILEKANLETISFGKKFELLNCDDHMNQIRKYKKDPAFCRPDITHQCLLMLFDSPLNRAGLLQVFIHTQQNVLIEIDPQTRLPRTFKRFANLMVQLLHKLGIRSTNGPNKLLRVIKNPITSHLPVGCRKIGTSFQSKKLVHPKDLVPTDENPVAIVIGAMAHGQADVDYVEETVSISQYPLSAALACTKIVSAFEDAWGIH
ncbi:ribosomal RNA small subunit methyltransferase NEP1-like protein [Dinothrombium tinctorium]|uniref:18S rRNA (pseudouridine-N1)-methyltransferase n=1 Tax=Dinothrombium tinctorium TaxID=1965070 RepID=A0A3S3PQX9_9ACAR|nr:ribosomal RNA small subunit methyltransferase NEP1-like protein [Dinothrombium tinctorium]